MTTYQLRNPSSSLPKGLTEARGHGSHKLAEDNVQKRELRLLKNR